MKQPETLWGPVLIFLGISAGAFVALIAILTWSHTLP